MRDEVFVVDQAGKARIVAGKNRTNGQIVFPYPDGEGEGAYERIELPQSGTLWTFTIQRIPPKNPPYVGVANPDDYEPYGVGYVRLGDEIMIEGRLVADPESLRIGMPMDCVAISLAKADGGEMMTYAFASSEQGNNS